MKLYFPIFENIGFVQVNKKNKIFKIKTVSFLEE